MPVSVSASAESICFSESSIAAAVAAVAAAGADRGGVVTTGVGILGADVVGIAAIWGAAGAAVDVGTTAGTIEVSGSTANVVVAPSTPAATAVSAV